MLELAQLAIGDGSALGEQGPVVVGLLEEAVVAGTEALWALALAMALLATPGVESDVTFV